MINRISFQKLVLEKIILYSKQKMERFLESVIIHWDSLVSNKNQKNFQIN